MTDQERLFITGMTDVAIAMIAAGEAKEIQESLGDSKQTVADMEDTIDRMRLGISEMGRIQAACEARLSELAGGGGKPKKIKGNKNTLLRTV